MGEWRSENISGENHPSWEGGKRELECDWCGKTFREWPGVADERRFCSEKCFSKYGSERFSGDGNPNWNGGPVELKCEVCGATYTAESRYADSSRCCSRSCLGTWISENLSGESAYWWGSEGPDAANWSGGTFPYGPGWNERKKEAVRERDDWECQHCGRSESEHIEKFGCKHHVHHIEKARSFDDPEKRNAMDNLVTLCVGQCHAEWERLSPLRPAPKD